MERLDVYKPWKHKRLLKELEQRIYVDSAESFQESNYQDFRNYLSDKDELYQISLYLTGLYHLRHAAHKSLTDGKPDLERLSIGVMYWLRSQQFLPRGTGSVLLLNIKISAVAFSDSAEDFSHASFPAAGSSQVNQILARIRY